MPSRHAVTWNEKTEIYMDENLTAIKDIYFERQMISKLIQSYEWVDQFIHLLFPNYLLF